MQREKIEIWKIFTKASGIVFKNIPLFYILALIGMFVNNANLIFQRLYGAEPPQIKYPLMILGYLISFSCYILSVLLAAQIARGQTPDIKGNLKNILPKLLRYFSTFVLFFSMFTAGMFFFVIPSVFAAVFLFIGGTCAVLEDNKTGPLKMSVKLLEGYFLPLLPFALIFLVIPGAVGFFFSKELTNVLIMALVTLIMTPINVVFEVLLYLKLKEIKKDELENEITKNSLKALHPLLGLLLGALILAGSILLLRGAINFVNARLPQSGLLNSLRSTPVIFMDAEKKYSFKAPKKWQITRMEIPETAYQFYNPSALVIPEAEIFKKSFDNSGFPKVNVYTDKEMLKTAVIEMAAKLRNGFEVIRDDETRERIYKETHLGEYALVEMSITGNNGVMKLERKAEKEEGLGSYFITARFMICRDFVIFMSYENRLSFNDVLEEVKTDYLSEQAVLDDVWANGTR